MAWDWGRHELDATPGGPAALVSPAAFLVVAAMPGRRIPAHVRELVSNPDGPGLAFAVRRHHHWRSAAGDLVVGVWQHHEGPEDDHWWAEGDDLAVLVGRRRRFGEAWAPPVRAVASFAAEAADRGPAAAAAGALGAFGAVTAESPPCRPRPPCAPGPSPRPAPAPPATRWGRRGTPSPPTRSATARASRGCANSPRRPW
jgi:hypothetical protein